MKKKYVFLLLFCAVAIIFGQSSSYKRNGVSLNVDLFSKKADINRFWLTLSTPNNIVNTIAIVYVEGASNGYDKYDSALNTVGSDSFYSFADNSTVPLAIQGRFPFVQSDVVNLETKHFVLGNYTMAIYNPQGIFANAAQAVYLKDKLLGTETNLQNGAYTFLADAGTITDRFSIVFQPSSSLGVTSNEKKDVSVYKNGEVFVVRSVKNISWVEVYDGTGKLVKRISGNSPEVSINSSGLAKGVYLLKIGQDNKVFIEKILK